MNNNTFYIGLALPSPIVKAKSGIWYDENNIIRKIVVDTKYVVKTYPSDVNEQLKKFIGEKLEFDEVKRNEENS